MPPNNACASDGKPAVAAQCPLPNESHERRRKQESSPAGAAPRSLGNEFTDGIARDVSRIQVPRWSRKALLWLGLLLILSMADMVAERPSGNGSPDIHEGATRIGWYFRSGQWLGDVRTAAAACQFLMHADPDAAPANPSVTLEPQSPPNPSTIAEAGEPSQSGS